MHCVFQQVYGCSSSTEKYKPSLSVSPGAAYDSPDYVHPQGMTFFFVTKIRQCEVRCIIFSQVNNMADAYNISVGYCSLFASGRPHDIPNMAVTASWPATGGKQLPERIGMGLNAAGSCSPADHRRFATFPVPGGHGAQQHASPTANGTTQCVDSQYHAVPCCDPMVMLSHGCNCGISAGHSLWFGNYPDAVESGGGFDCKDCNCSGLMLIMIL